MKELPTLEEILFNSKKAKKKVEILKKEDI